MTQLNLGESRKPRRRPVKAKPNGRTKITDSDVVADHGMSFTEKLDWLIKHPPKGSVRMKITPAMAGTMLARVRKPNRPVSAMKDKGYAWAMANKRWGDNRQPIQFDKNGDMVDGQHRCNAIIHSKTSIMMDLVFGVDPAAFDRIDIGKVRQASDIFAIEGIAHYATTAAATRLVLSYDQGKLGGGSIGAQPPGYELLSYYYELRKTLDIADSTWIASAFKTDSLAPPSPMQASHYICARLDHDEADEFFRQVADGIGFKSRSEPGYKLRGKFNQAKKDGEIFMRGGAVLGWAITAWNIYRDGKKSVLKFDKDQPFPTAR